MQLDALALAVTPFAFLPGVALLVMSTQARMATLLSELQRHTARDDPSAAKDAAYVLRRGLLLRDALFWLYCSVVVLSLAGLAGAAADLTGVTARTVTLALSGVGILAMVIGAVLLVMESRKLLGVVRREVERHRVRLGVKGPPSPPS